MTPSNKITYLLLLLPIVWTFALANNNNGEVCTGDICVDSNNNNPMTDKKKTVLVVGATGDTGKHVVQQMLDLGHSVKAVVRSEERMMGLLKDEDYGDRLALTEASLLDLKDEQLKELVQGSDAVVSCLGHNMNFKGLWGKPRKLVTDATKRLTQAIDKDSKTKFILMGSDGVANPDGTDDVRPVSERSIIFVLRHTLPPHADNEGAAAYLYQLGTSSGVEWAVVRPTDLIDGEVSKYGLYDKPQGALFGSGTATRANVADSMVQLITKEDMWNQWKYKMPVLLNQPTEETDAK